MAPKRRTEARYACRLCPNGPTFDRLRKGAESSWSKSLEYHVENTHPEHIDDWASLKGEKTTEPRPWAREEQEGQEQSFESANELSEAQVRVTDEEDRGADDAAAPLPAKDADNGVETATRPMIDRQPLQIFAATAPSVSTMEPIVLRCGEVDQLALDGKLGRRIQELAQKVFPYEDEDPVPIASQHIVRYLLAKVKKLQAFYGEVLYEMPFEEIKQIREEMEQVRAEAEGEEDAEEENQGETLQEAATNLEAQQKIEPEQGDRAKKRARGTPVETEEEEEVSKAPKRRRLVLKIGSSQRAGVDDEHDP